MANVNQLTREIHSVIYPKAVLIAYTTEDSHAYFLELRSIDSDGKMSEGRPVTVEFMNELVRNYSEVHDGTPCGPVPANLLYCDTRKGNEKYVWYNPPQKRLMYFVDNLNIDNAEYHVPGVIYEATERGLNIYAYKDSVPGPETQLFAAPFFNVSGASVCIGNAKIERPGASDLQVIHGVLGKEILADGVLPPRKPGQSYCVESRAGDKGRARRPVQH